MREERERERERESTEGSFNRNEGIVFIFCIFYMIIFQAFMLLYHAVCMQILAEDRVKEEIMMKLEKMMIMI